MAQVLSMVVAAAAAAVVVAVAVAVVEEASHQSTVAWQQALSSRKS